MLITGTAIRTNEIDNGVNCNENNEKTNDNLNLNEISNSPSKGGKKISRINTNAISSPLQFSIEQLSQINDSNLTKEPIIVTNLDHIPGYTIKRYLGCVSHHLVREIKEKDSTSAKNKLAYLASVFLREAISIARAHVISVGGEALIGFSVDNFSIITRSGYCLISFSGDAVTIQKKKLQIERIKSA